MKVQNMRRIVVSNDGAQDMLQSAVFVDLADSIQSFLMYSGAEPTINA